jgi:hypothetical protein
MNELIIDKLSFLNYETEFCPKLYVYVNCQYISNEISRMKSISKSFFLNANAKGQQGDQFHYFASLIVWLLSNYCNGLETTLNMPGPFDDPNVVCSNISMSE